MFELLLYPFLQKSQKLLVHMFSHFYFFQSFLFETYGVLRKIL